MVVVDLNFQSPSTGWARLGNADKLCITEVGVVQRSKLEVPVVEF